MSTELDRLIGRMITAYEGKIDSLETQLAEMTALKEMWQDEALLYPTPAPESSLRIKMAAAGCDAALSELDKARQLCNDYMARWQNQEPRECEGAVTVFDGLIKSEVNHG